MAGRAHAVGFTMVELIVAIILFGIIGAMVSRVLTQGFTSYVTGRNIAEVDWQSRVALERITRDLRTIRSPGNITISSSSDLSFVDGDGATIRYCAGAVGTCPGATGDLVRNTQVLATGVTGLAISYLTKTGISTVTPAQVYYVVIAFTATQGSIAKDFSVVVSPRNFP